MSPIQPVGGHKVRPRKARLAILVLAVTAALLGAAPSAWGQAATKTDPLARIDVLIKAKDYTGALRALADLAKSTLSASLTDTSLNSSQILAAAKTRYSEIVATGGKYDRLLEAQFLLALKDYNATIAFLTDFIKKNPDRFDEAQSLLKKVVAVREEYNRVLKEFIDTALGPGQGTPDVEAKKLDLIQRLRDLDPNPNPEIRKSVESAKAFAQYVVYRSQFESIFKTGRQLIDQGKYTEAAAAYAAGFGLYRQEFNDGPYDDITKQAVAGMVDRVNAEIAYFASSQASLTSAVSAFGASLAAGDPARAAAAWPAARTALEDRARRRDIVVKAGRAMSAQYDIIKLKDNTVTDSSFLPFAFRITLGNLSAAQPEGVAGAMDSQFIKLMGDLESAFSKKSEELYAAAEAAYDRGDMAAAASGFATVNSLAQSGLPALGLWSLIAPTELFPALSAYGKTVVQSKPVLYERARQLALSAESEAVLAGLVIGEMATLGQAKTLAAAFTPDSDLQATLAGLVATRKASLAYHAAVDVESAKAAELAAELARWKAQGLETPDFARTMDAWRKRLDDASARGRADEIAIVDLGLGIEFGRLEAEYGFRASDLAQGKLLLDGAESAGTTGGAALVAHYPSRSMAALAAQAQNNAAYRAKIVDYLAREGKESAWIVADETAKSWAAKARELLARADALEADRVATLARATAQKRQADSARAEADLRMQQAKDALAKDDFDTARDRLSKAGDRYLASLGLEENADLRAASDAAQQKLGADIIKAENDKVIRDTRVLITSAKTAYFQGNFTKAEDSLLQARSRWATTHGKDQEPEVEYWLRLAQAALSVNTGRTIAPTAPLYAEMSQLLSLARADFDRGKASLDARKTDAAKVSFASARSRINQVKVVFPLNQEAGVLALRIDQLQDPAAFRQEFARKFNDAKAGLKAVTQEVYANLQDLAKIDPTYPGIKDAIYQAEIGLGLRLPPPDPAKQRRANDLIAAARAIVDAGNTTQFSIALQQINEAIQLDPNNDRALSIKDRILTFQGGSAQIVLSSAAEELYRQAVQAFQSENFIQADAIVARLLQDPKNQNSQKIIDLSKKIKSRL